MPEFKIKVKRGTVAPATGSLDVGELGYNTASNVLYVGNGSGQNATAFLSDADVVTSLSTSLSGLSLSNSGQGDVALSGTLGAASGGTGLSSYTAGDLLVASGSTALSKLGIGSNNQLLRVNSGSVEWWTPNFLTSFTESDPVFTAHAAYNVTSTKISNWDTAYGWGDHSLEGYLVAADIPDLSVSSSGSGNAITALTVNEHTITITKGSTFLTAESDTLDTVTDRGATTTNSITIGALTASNGTFSGDVAVDGGDLTTNATSFQLLTDNASLANITLGNAATTTTVPGNLVIQGTTTTVNVETVNTSNGIIFEGVTDDTYETTLNVVDPTADRAINLPDASGTIALVSDIPTNNNELTNGAGYITSAQQTDLSVGTTGSGDFITAISVDGHEISYTRGNETHLSTASGTAGNYVSGITVSDHQITVNKAAWPTFNQDTTGNAATATALETARTIAGKSFDGTANITIAIDDLSDVSITSASSGDYLKYDGSDWVNAAFPTLTTTFQALTDTPASFGTAGQTLVVNGTADGLIFADANDHAHSASDITSGTLGVARGGTGAASFTSGQVLIGAGTSAVTTASRSGIDTRSSFPPSAHTVGSHSDVTITSVADGELLQYSSSSSAWVNVAVIDCGEYTT